MTELYRGLLLVLTEKFTDLIATLRMHIRMFRDPAGESILDAGVSGFWNFILEVIFTLFVIGCLCAGITLTAVLAIVAYPLKAALNVSASVLKHIRNPQNEADNPSDRIPPELSEPPVIKKK